MQVLVINMCIMHSYVFFSTGSVMYLVVVWLVSIFIDVSPVFQRYVPILLNKLF